MRSDLFDEVMLAGRACAGTVRASAACLPDPVQVDARAAHRVREGWQQNEQDPAFAEFLASHEGQFDEGYFDA